jgi:predicted ester cyclase
VDVEDVISEGDMVAARCSVRASHLGEGLGIAASNRPIEISGMSFVRIRDGKIVEGWNNFDFMSLYRQVGAI